MLIPLKDLVDKRSMDITGVVHIGAHLGEELKAYQELGIEDVLWVEADPDTYKKLREKVPNTHTTRCAAVSDTSGEIVSFNRSNNGQSSSILELGTHKTHHPEVVYVDTIEVTTITVDDLLENYKKPYNFLNLDIQGLELAALRGATKALETIDYIYTEVNIEPVYVGCGFLSDIEEFLGEHGFQLMDISMTPFRWGDAFFMKNP